MAKMLLLYNGIYSDTAAQFLQDLEANKDNNPYVRVNTPGGDPFSTYGMIAKAGEVNAKYQVDGQANSCGFYLIANAGKDNVECLSVSTFIAHRAASWMEKYPDIYPDAKKDVAAVNVHLRAIIENNLPDFEKVTGVTLDNMFSMDTRIDVRINARQALKMGLVGKVNKLTKGSAKDKEIQAFAAQHQIAAYSTDIDSSTDNFETMEYKNLAELRAAFPGLIAEAENTAVDAAIKKTITAERKRILAWNRFAKVDPEAVKKGIEEGLEVDMDVISEMTIKLNSPEYLEALKKGNTAIPVTEGQSGAGAATEADKFMAEADKQMGWGEKKK